MSKKGHTKKDKDGEVEVDPDAFVLSTDAVIGDVQRKAMGVFGVFDPQNSKSCDVREVGTMCRALDLYPTEADVHEIIGGVEEPTAKGTVRQNTFINYMTKVIIEGKFKPVSQDDLFQAFRAVDKDKKGTLDPIKFKDMLMKEGEPFTAEEVDDFNSFAVNKTDNLIHWEEYVQKLYRTLRL